MANPEDEPHYTKLEIGPDDQPVPIFETVPVESRRQGEVVVEDAGQSHVPVEIDSQETQGDIGSNGSIPPTSPPISYVPPSEGFEEHSGGHWKIYIALGLIFFVLMTALVFLFNTLRKKTSPQKVRLVYWGLFEEKAVVEPLIIAYQEKNKNVTIEYSKQSPKDYREKVVARSKNGEGPDIFRFHNTWLPMLHDTLSPLAKDVMTNDEFEKTFYKVVQDDVKEGNSYYGIPLYIDDLVLLYNDDFFKQVGINAPPATWDDVITYANQLTVPDDLGAPITAGIALGTAGNVEHFSDILGWMLLQNGADLKGVASVEGEQVLKRYREFAEAPNPVWSEDMPNSIAAFTQGKVAMIFAPFWELANIKALNSELNVKVAKLPVLPGETEPFSVSNYWVEGVARTSKHQKEAWKFLKFLSSRDSQTKMYELQVKSRGFGAPYSRVDLKDTLLQNDDSAAVIAQAPYLKSVPTISRTFDNGLNDQINSYLEDAINNAISGVSYSQAMEQAQDGIVSVFDKYKIR